MYIFIKKSLMDILYMIFLCMILCIFLYMIIIKNHGWVFVITNILCYCDNKSVLLLSIKPEEDYMVQNFKYKVLLTIIRYDTCCDIYSVM